MIGLRLPKTLQNPTLKPKFRTDIVRYSSVLYVDICLETELLIGLSKALI